MAEQGSRGLSEGTAHHQGREARGRTGGDQGDSPSGITVEERACQDQRGSDGEHRDVPPVGFEPTLGPF